MRSYGQYCSIARALDVVGDRWTLLIVRELLLQGPCRFTDLKNGLPGIATNLLSTRLKELEDAGLISREDAPPVLASARRTGPPSRAAAALPSIGCLPLTRSSGAPHSRSVLSPGAARQQARRSTHTTAGTEREVSHDQSTIS